jgi:hypothetical protein
MGEDTGQQSLQSSPEAELLGPGETEKHGQQRTGQDDDILHVGFSLMDGGRTMNTPGARKAG